MQTLVRLDGQSHPMQQLNVTDSEAALAREQATQFALWRGLALVLLPGLAFVVGLIALVVPALPPTSTLNGCYRLNTSPLIRVSPGVISVDGDAVGPIRMSVEPGKEGYVINAVAGFSFKTDGNGRLHAYRDYRRGELIPVFIARNRPPSLGLISDGQSIKIPKVDCPAA